MVLRFYSIFCRLGAERGNQVCCMHDTSDPLAAVVHRKSLQPIGFSLAIAPTNVMPYVSYTGRKLEACDGWRYQGRGRDMNDDGFVPIVVGYTGDWMYQVSEYNIPYSYLQSPGHICNVCYGVGAFGCTM